MNNIDRFAAEYLDYHAISPKRASSHLSLLRRFCASTGVDSPEQATADDVRAFLAEEVNRVHPNTVRWENGMLRAFFTWAYEADLIDGNQLMKFKTVRNPNGSTGNSTPKPYSSKELRQFWKELDESWPFVDEKWWTRWRSGRSRYKRIASEVMRTQLEAVVALALHLGLRRREIYYLSIDDMHPDNAYVVVRQRARTPNGKDRLREVPFTETAREAVRVWLDMRTELDPPHDRPWIVARSNVPEGVWLEPISLDSFGRLLTTVGQKRGLGEKRDHWKLHRFRHTSATNWLRAGVKLEVLQRHIGHARLTQTLEYAKLVRDDIQRAVEVSEGRFEQLLGRRDDA